MQIRTALVSTLSALLVTQTPAAAQSATFQLIPDALSANDMSPDGRWIVGGYTVGGFFEDGAYRYDTVNDVMLILPPPAFSAVAVSDDGSVVLGNMPDPTTEAQVAAIWRESTNTWESLGFLPNAQQCPSLSSAYELSADGSVAIGLSWEGCSGRGFIWTESDGMLELESLANGSNRASVVSGDGTVIGGFAQGSFSRTPAMWDASTDGELLDPPNGDLLGEILGIRDDGSQLFGTASIDPMAQSNRAVRWTEANGFEQIGQGSVFSAWAGNAMDMADNGTVVGFDTFLTSRQAWIQYRGEGNLEALKGFVVGLGATVPAGLNLDVAQAISADGSRIIGHGAGVAWMIEIEDSPACSADLNGDGVVDGADLASLLAAWGSSNSPADLNGDGIVDGADLATMLSLWNSTC